MSVLRTNVGMVKINKSNDEFMTNADLRLQHYFQNLLNMVEKTSKSAEDSILLAGAMMSVARVVYYDTLGPQQGQQVMDTNMADFIELIKPTIH
jgi:hypothetical protein|tara:strand:- start:777 stop:1058 length:282 start_codon:yes stop_codon:yes gene_type:complete